MIGGCHGKRSNIVSEHEGRCEDDHGDGPCAICRGEMSEEFVAMVQRAGAAEPSRRMTGDEFVEWLRDR